MRLSSRALILLAAVLATVGVAGCATGPRVVARFAAPVPHRLVKAPAPAPLAPQTTLTGLGPFGSMRATGSKAVALTFDDGPSPKFTPELLALLKQNHVHATFCLVGVEAAAYPALVRQIVADGHTLCDHSWHHEFKLGTETPALIRANMLRTLDAIHHAAPGAPVRYFRQPGGEWTLRDVQVATALGMRPLDWSVDPQDWRKPGAQVIFNKVTATTRPGAIVLMHDGGGDRTGTIDALREILPLFTQRYRLIPLP